MIKHIVAWDFPDEHKKENTAKLKALLDELPALISEIKIYEVGINIKVSEFAKDMVLISGFEDQAALDRYTAHPEHVRVVKELRKKATKTVVVDFKT